MRPVVIPKRFTKFNAIDQAKLLSLVTQMDDLVIGICVTDTTYIIENLNDTEFELYAAFVEAFDQMDSQFIQYLIQVFGISGKFRDKTYDLVFNRNTLFRYNLVDGSNVYPFTMQQIHIKYVARIVGNLGFIQHPKNVYNEYNSAIDAINSYVNTVLYLKEGEKPIQSKWQVIPIKSFL